MDTKAIMDSKDLIETLLSCGIFKVGNFKLKTGSFSPIYIDLRQIINKPSVIKDIAIAIRNKLAYKPDVVCGVPYTALPIASVFSVEYNVPMLIKRKEAKDYGTKKLIEGNIRPEDTCVIIEDIVSSGSSVIETAETLRKEGLKVQECIVVVNRNQGGEENLLKAGIKLHQLFDIQYVFDAYCRLNTIEPELVDQVKSYFKNNDYLPVKKTVKHVKTTHAERAKAATHPVAKRLFNIMEEKKSNLCVAIDTTSSHELLDLANRLGSFICILKTHIDILDDFSSSVIDKLKMLSKKHNFLLFEDRKFADIGNTVKHQFLNGQYKIQSWADMVTAHALPGNGIIEALKNETCACILVAEMSSKGTLTDSEYKESVVKMAEMHSDSVIGYVAQSRQEGEENLLHMCPGVSVNSVGDSLGQQYKAPNVAIREGADVIIVGRSIWDAANPVACAELYQHIGYDNYLYHVSKKL